MTKVCEHDTWPKGKARQKFWSTIFGKVTKWGCMVNRELKFGACIM